MSAVSNKTESSQGIESITPCRLFSKDMGAQNLIDSLLKEEDESFWWDDAFKLPSGYGFEYGGTWGNHVLAQAAYSQKSCHEALMLYVLDSAPKSLPLHRYGNIYGWTPLFFAAAGNSIRAAEHLLRIGAQPNIASTEAGDLDGQAYPIGSTPLYAAAKKGHLEMCRLLIHSGAQVHPKLEPEVRGVLREACLSVARAIAKETNLPLDLAEIAASYAGAPATQDDACVIQ